MPGACPSNGSDCVTGAVSPDTRHLRRRRCSGIVEEQEQSRWTHATCNPWGAWGLRPISLSFVVADATASTPPLFATSTRKPHARNRNPLLGQAPRRADRSATVIVESHTADGSTPPQPEARQPLLTACFNKRIIAFCLSRSGGGIGPQDTTATSPCMAWC